MNDFSIQQSGFAGFRLIRQHPAAFVVWLVIGVVYMVGYSALGTYMAGDAFQALADIQAHMRETREVDPGSLLQVTAQTQGFNAVGLIFRLVFTVLLSAAVIRAILRPAKRGLAYLRLGPDELRLFVTLLVVAVVTFVAAIVGGIVTLILTAVAAGIDRAVDGPRFVILIGTGVGVALMAVAVIFITLKLALAPAQTMAFRQIRIFDSWSQMRGRMLKLLGAYVLALIGLAPFAAIALGGALWAASQMGGVSGWRDLFQFLTFPPFTPADLFSPARLVFYTLVGLLFGLAMTVILAVPVSAYQQITGYEDGASVADDDDEDWDDDDED